jgi:hypothetical protein
MASRTADPRELTYSDQHPMRVDHGNGRNHVRIMPHDLPGEDAFEDYLILQGMTQEDYWQSVAAGERVAVDLEENGRPFRTSELTDDQRGWAKGEFFDHYQRETSRWRIDPKKPSRPIPYKPSFSTRTREYREHCDDGETATVKLWGYRWDNRKLYQCQDCGEVILSRDAEVKTDDNTDDIDEDFKELLAEEEGTDG